MTSASERQPDQRVLGIDVWRFILATWVFVGHMGLPALPEAWEAGPLRLVLRGFRGNIVSGPAAVIVFFVLSGFCIHYPNRHTNTVRLLPYFARRHIRIWVPVLVSIALTLAVGQQFEGLNESVLWSLVCEEVYYMLYPLMLPLVRRHGWNPLVMASFAFAYAVVVALPNNGNYPSYGIGLNWVVGLPCWLLGARLAARIDTAQSTNPTTSAVWAWRVGALALSAVCSVLRFHSPLTYPWTLDIFALFCAQWICVEIAAARGKPPSIGERLGAASYSIYLTHLVALEVVVRAGINSWTSLWGWFAAFIGVLILCTGFYFLVERPSHRLSRFVARRLMNDAS